MPTATFPEIFNGLFFRLMLRICVQNLKFVALPVPENLDSLWIRPRSLFSKNFNGHFVRMDPVNVLAKFEVHSFARS